MKEVIDQLVKLDNNQISRLLGFWIKDKNILQESSDCISKETWLKIKEELSANEDTSIPTLITDYQKKSLKNDRQIK